MARSENQKLKLLYIVKILMEETDMEHPMSMQTLIDKLAANNIKAERKSIYNIHFLFINLQNNTLW